MIITGNNTETAFVAKGVYESPCGKWWSNKPITREQVAYDKVYDHCVRYNKSFSKLNEELCAGSKENLPKWVRNWFIDWYEPEEEIKITI